MPRCVLHRDTAVMSLVFDVSGECGEPLVCTTVSGGK